MRKGESEQVNWLFIVLGIIVVAFILFLIAAAVLRLWPERKPVEPPKVEEMQKSVETLCNAAITDPHGAGEVDFSATGEAQYGAVPLEIKMIDFAQKFSEVRSCFPEDSCLEFAPGGGGCVRQWDGASQIDFVDVCSYYDEDFESLRIHIVCAQGCDEPLTGIYKIEAKKVLPGHATLPDFCLFFNPLSDTTSEVGS